MKKFATGAVFVALVVASVAPAAAAISRPKASTVDVAALTATVPVTFETASTSSPSTAAFPKGYDPVLYSGLLGYFKADAAYQVLVYQDLVKLGVGSEKLSEAYAALQASLKTLVTYLSTGITNA